MGQSQSQTVKISQQDRAILDLKLQRDKLKQYQKKTEHVLERERQAAKDALAAGRKDKALTALRRRKYQEQLLVKTDNQLETLQQLVSSIEFSLVEKDVLFGLKQGNAVLKELHKEMTVESVDKLMGETADSIAYQREIDEMLSNRITMDEEDAVQQELAQLEAEAVRSSVPSSQRTQLATSMPAAPEARLPDAPTRNVESAVEEEPARAPERTALLA